MSDDKARRMFQDIRATADQIRSTPWSGEVAKVALHGVDGYSTPLFAAAKVALERGDPDAEGVFVLLASITSMYYDDDDLEEPFKPMVIMRESRSAALSDFEDQHLQPLAEVYRELTDLEMQARIADVLWVRRRDHEAARVAVRAYLQRAKDVMHPEEWVHGFERLKRAMQIASSLGNDTLERQEVVAYAEELLAKLSGNDPLYLTHSIIELLLTYKAADMLKLADYAAQNAAKAGQRGNNMVAADYWALAATCRNRAGDEAGARTAVTAQGEAQIALGEEMAASGVKGLASEHWVEQGFLTLRQAGADKERLVTLQKRVEELQRLRSESMGKIATSVPIDPKLIAHLEKVKGKTFRDALTFLALQVLPLSKEQLWKHVEMMSPSVMGMVQRQLLREDGKVDYVLAPLPLDEAPSDGLKRDHMWQMAETLRVISAWKVKYIRQIIADEHPWQPGALEWLLKGNSFVPAGREAIYDRALRAGLEGDYLIATHLLSALIENSIRYVLSQHGILTSSLKQDGTQHEFSINKLVELDAFEEVFGADFAFELRGLLAERAGANLRNNVSHGLWSFDHFHSPASVVLFSLAVLMLLHGLPTPPQESESGPEGQ